MNIYLVGGAVRDKLLDYPTSERDWVVVGATPEDMLDKGFRQVGKDFPVFLHPVTNEEYALARTERKSGSGYTGFEVHSAPTVTLEEDLLRRDLTVNAMALDDTGRVIDPYGGQADLQNRVLRHVSDAFVEDPLRVLRVARFAARFAHLGFTVADPTTALMAEITRRGELSTIAAERIWVETEKALNERDPQVFVEVLRSCGALHSLYPEVDALFGVPQKASYHPEVDTGVHVLLTLKQAARLHHPGAGRQSLVTFAALTHDLGKGITPEDVLPSHRGHESAGLPLVEELCRRLRVPNKHRDLAVAVCADHLNCHRGSELRPETLMGVLERTGALRDAQRFEGFLIACEADSRGRTGLEDRPYPQAAYFRAAREAVVAITAADVRTRSMEGPEIGRELREARVSRLSALRQRERTKADPGSEP